MDKIAFLQGYMQKTAAPPVIANRKESAYVDPNGQMSPWLTALLGGGAGAAAGYFMNPSDPLVGAGVGAAGGAALGGLGQAGYNKLTGPTKANGVQQSQEQVAAAQQAQSAQAAVQKQQQQASNRSRYGIPANTQRSSKGQYNWTDENGRSQRVGLNTRTRRPYKMDVTPEKRMTPEQYAAGATAPKSTPQQQMSDQATAYQDRFKHLGRRSAVNPADQQAVARYNASQAGDSQAYAGYGAQTQTPSQKQNPFYAGQQLAQAQRNVKGAQSNLNTAENASAVARLNRPRTQPQARVANLDNLKQRSNIAGI